MFSKGSHSVSKEHSCKDFVYDTLPKVLFHDYLPQLVDREKEICLNLHMIDRLTTGDTLCVFPDGWLTDHVS